MTNKNTVIVSLVAAIVLLSGPLAAKKQPYIDSSDEAAATVDGLYPVKDTRFDLAFAKADLDLSAYEKVMLAPVSIAYKRRSNELDEQQTARMLEYFEEAMRKELGEKYQLVEAAGADVLLVEASIIDLYINRPTEPTIGRNKVFTASSGEMTLIGELKDSVSGEILARFADRKQPRNYWAESTSVSEWSEVNRAFRAWARILRSRLDLFHDKEE